MKDYTCDGQMSIFDILGQEPAKPKQQGYDYSNPILNHMLEELKEIFTVTEIKYEVWEHVPNLGKRMTATLKDLPDVWDITEMMDRYLKDYELELSTTIWDPLSGEKEIWLSTMWKTKGHKERTDWKEEPKKIKLPLSMKYCSIIGADCACHDEKGCKYPEKCGLLKEVAENNNLEREENMAAVQEKPIRQPCGRPCDEYMWPDEIDCEVCPECGTPLDWKVWHLKNDPKLKDKYPDLDTRYINPDTKEIENHPFEWKYTDTNPPKIEDIYFGCIVSKDNDGEDMYTYTTIRFMDGVYWIFNHPHKEWETLEKGNKGNTVIAWREYTSSELKTIRDYDSMVIYEIEEEEEEEEEKPAPKEKESKRASKKATKKKPDPEEKEEEEDGERDQEDM